MEITYLLNRIEALSARCETMSARLVEAAALLEARRVGGLGTFSAELASLELDFQQIRAELQAVAIERNRDDVAQDAGTADSISQLCELLRGLGDQETTQRAEFERQRKEALCILEKCMQLTYGSGREFPPLKVCRTAAAELAPALAAFDFQNGSSAVADLVAGAHPLTALVRFIEGGADLNDDDWEKLRSTIAEHFGQALAIAASRGKIEFASAPKQGPTPAPALEETQGPEHPDDTPAIPDMPAPGHPPAPPWKQEVEPVPGPVVVSTAEGAAPVPARVSEVASPEIPIKPEPVREGSVSQPAAEQPELASRSNVLLWRLMGAGRSGLAYQFARYIESTLPALSILPSWLLRAAAIGPSVRFSGGEIAQTLRTDFERFSASCFRELDVEWNNSVRLLAAASALRPGLLAPETGASTVLYQLHFGAGAEHLFQFCQVIGAFGDHNHPLDPTALKVVQDAAVWRADVERLRGAVEAWIERAPQMTIKYAPAGQVWRRWLQKDQFIWNLLRPIRENEIGGSTERQISKWSNMNEVDRLVRHTDRIVLERRAGKEITADPLFQIRRHVSEALDFLRSWVELQKHAPNHGPSASGQEIENLKSELLRLHGAVIADLAALRRENSSPGLHVAAALCEATVNRIGDLFDPTIPIPSSEPDLPTFLDIDLLHVRELHISDTWEPQWKSVEGALADLEEFAAGAAPSWQQTFDCRCEQRDHLGTLRILEYLEQERESALGADAVHQLQLRRGRHLQSCLEALRRDVVDTRQEVEKSLALGLVTEGDHTDMVSRIQAVEASCERTLDFAPQHALLEGVRSDIESRRRRQVEEARLRMVAEIPSSHSAYPRIQQVLDNGDVSSAHAYIDMARQNIDLPTLAARREVLREFFPERVRALMEFLDQYLKDKNVRDLVDLIANRRNFAGIDMTPVTGAGAERASAAVKVWFQLKQQRSSQTDPEGYLRELLAFLGFQGASLARDPTRRGESWNFRAVPLTQREQCPIPRFGSEAKGHYRLLCVWDRPNEEDLVNEIGDALTTPVLVFFFGRLSEPRRRNLARLCRERRRTFLVLDEILLLHLCGVPGSRLPAFFDCAVPFTYVGVYVTSAGLVPPEMFYGRRTARESVLLPEGSCFIYGGRQLGKTALLRDVEGQFHAPEHGRLALWLDLKARGIGYDRPADDLWMVLDDELVKLGLWKKKHRPQADKLLDAISDWILGNANRRMLLLLDEADRFLEIDGAKEHGGEYVRAARLKGLMDRTHRRFKVVFAGLHNVQRTTKLGNHPLAHYGMPICVGPLFEDGEWREARALIEAPFAAIGYRFEDPDLVTRILSQTNYYPSLIQLYGHQLFLHLIGQSMVRTDWRTGPPFVITARDVEDAYHSQDLRKAIRDRFIWTLQLDRRYEVIAYAISYALVGDELIESEKKQFSLDGFPVSWIQREAFAWWRDGLGANFSEDAFRVLLDEMVGLGILRSVGNRYGLRSPNVLALMGTADEITAKLLETREVESDYAPAVARAVCSPDQTWCRSPLSGQQEELIKKDAGGVSIVMGTAAAGLTDVPSRLRAMFGDSIIEIDGITGRGSIRRALVDGIGEKGRDMKSGVFIVPAVASWTEESVRDAIEFVRAQRAASKLKVIFIAGPESVWKMLESNWHVFDELEHLGADLLGLSPWHEQAVRQWLDDCGFAVGPDGRKRVREHTGSWPLLLYRFYELARGDESHWESHLGKLRISSADFGLTAGLGTRVVGSLAVVSPASEEYVANSVQEAGWANLVAHGLEWGRRLNLVRFSSQGRWEVDPVLQQLDLAV